MRRVSGLGAVLAVLWMSGVSDAATAKRQIKVPATVGQAVVDETTSLKFVRLPKGCFQMGSPAPAYPTEDFHWRHLGITAPIDQDERPVHRVCVDAFSIGSTEVTAAAWLRVMGEVPAQGKDNEPASGASWQEVQRFIALLNAKGAARYRLPTEAEWEYACRAGKSDEPVRNAVNVIDGAWYAHDKIYRGRPQEVGQLPGNAWGLFDMLGNVWEWTADAYRPNAYRQHPLFNPRQPPPRDDETTDYVIRGASFRSEFLQVRCASRSHYGAADALQQIGFRLVVSE